MPLTQVQYTTPTGTKPVREYISAQDAQARAAIYAAINTFRDEFPDIRTVSIKPLQGKLWEIRVQDKRGVAHRVIYAVWGSVMLLLHAFTKKQQKTPPDAIRLAQKRLDEMTGG